MDHFDFVNTSLRLRYEALSKFATQVNQVDGLPEIGEALAANLKFILDTFAFRLATTINQETYTFEIFRGKCTINQPPDLSPFERNCIEEELPLAFTYHDIRQEVLLGDSLFSHPKITHLMVLPISYSSAQKLVLSVANKSANAYTEIDFRFARLIEELLSTKISQILLTQKVASKNIALERANEQLSQLNEEIHLLNTELENKVEERTSRLKEAHQELSILLYRTSHDFRRPLTAILGLAQLFTISESAEETEELAKHLGETVVELDGMLIKLQALTYIEREENPAEIDFSKLVEKIAKEFEQQLSESDTQFSYQIHQESSYLSHAAIHQAIIENLLENAIRYGSAHAPQVQLQIEEIDTRLVIRVSDNGVGIPKHLQPLIFDMYTKASDLPQGNGLGLFVVKKLVHAVGGSIEVLSTVQEGSTFTITLPLNEGQLSQRQSVSDHAALLR